MLHRSFTILSTLTLVLSSAACSVPTGTGEETPMQDETVMGTDAGNDTGAPVTANQDSGTGVGMLEQDSGSDAGSDSGSDSGDTGTALELDADSDSNSANPCSSLLSSSGSYHAGLCSPSEDGGSTCPSGFTCGKVEYAITTNTFLACWVCVQ